MVRDLQDRVAVVTGTANPRGIGLATARLLAARGCRLVLADVDERGVGQSVETLEEQGFAASGFGVDMSDPAAVETLADTAYERYGSVHILLLNHADQDPRSAHVLDADLAAWHRIIGVNLLGVVHALKAFVPRMMASAEHTHVLATVSGAGAIGVMYGHAGYAVTKQAITTLMECLYGQVRDAGADVHVGLIFPTVTATMPTREMAEAAIRNLNDAGVPVVLSTPEEVAEFTVDAIGRDSFWAHPSLEDDRRLTGGKHRATIGWECEVMQARADAFNQRRPPDPYLWGPGVVSQS
jgi:NAD(P)-dependent dehydrogenase (short-subunit alcohol dehydrogenase family)